MQPHQGPPDPPSTPHCLQHPQAMDLYITGTQAVPGKAALPCCPAAGCWRLQDAGRPLPGVAVQSVASSIPASSGTTLRWQSPCRAGLMGCVYWGTARWAPPHWSIPVLCCSGSCWVVPGQVAWQCHAAGLGLCVATARGGGRGMCVSV